MKRQSNEKSANKRAKEAVVRAKPEKEYLSLSRQTYKPYLEAEDNDQRRRRDELERIFKFVY